MMADAEFDLGWHGEWLPAHAHSRATDAFLETHGASDATSFEDALARWEHRSRALIDEVSWAMTGIEEPDFVQNAQLVAIDEFFGRICRLASTSPRGGSA